jgi:hypothetical protein
MQRREATGHKALMELILKDKSLWSMAQLALRQTLTTAGGLTAAAKSLNLSAPQALHPLIKILDLEDFVRAMKT